MKKYFKATIIISALLEIPETLIPVVALIPAHRLFPVIIPVDPHSVLTG